MKQLSIAVIQQTPDVGGAETYMMTLMESFQKRGHHVVLATNNDKFMNLVTPLKLTMTRIPVILDIIGNYRGLIKSIMLFPYALWFYNRLINQYKRQGVALIFMSGFSEKMLVTYLAQIKGIPVVWLEHGPLKTIFPRNFGLPRLIYRHASRFVSTIITPSEFTRKSLIRDGRIADQKVVHIPDGISIRTIEKQKTIDERFRGKFIIGNVSRLTREKGQQFLIEAMPEIIKAIPHAHLLIIGGGSDKGYFEERVRSLELSSVVTITDYVSDLDTYFSLMDVFVFPTIWDLEGFGLVTVEAMLHKLPVIGSNLGPVPEIIDDHKTGILVPKGNSQAIAKAVIMLAQDPLLRKSMGEAGFIKVKTCYDSNHIADEFLRIFTHVVTDYANRT